MTASTPSRPDAGRRQTAAALFIEELTAGEDPLAGFQLAPSAGGGEVVAYVERRRRSTERLIE